MQNFSKKTIKVGFFHQFSCHWIGGINYYKNLFMALKTLDNIEIIPYILPIEDKEANILLNYAKVIKPLKKDWKYKLIKFFKIVSKKYFDKSMYLYKCNELNLISHNSSQLKQTPEISTISWIPDFQHMRLPEMFSDDEIKSRNNIFKSMCKHSNIIIVSSEDALNDLRCFCPQAAKKGRILHFVAILPDNVYKKLDDIKEKTVKKLNLPKKYFYVPNQFWKHKNHSVILEAITILKQKGIDITVVFSGNTGDCRFPEYFESLKKYIKDNNIEDNVKILGIIDLQEVLYLMRNCISLINPSLFEGWSSTVEEAKSLGKNIILSNIAVHKEQNPPQSIYFDPKNAHELANILEKKWENGISGPDYKLEKEAREQLPNRIKNYAQEYAKIAEDAIAISSKNKEIDINNPKVTIVTCTYNLIKNNRLDTFKQCVNSVHKQTYKNVEHIIIDGGSNDGTIDLLKKYAKKGYFTYYSEPDDGIYDAMNKGIQKATGEYIAFLNSDDFYHNKNGIAETVKALVRSNADFSFAPIKMLDENNKNYTKHPHIKPSYDDVFIEMPYCHQSMFVKKDALIAENLFNKKYSLAADYDLIIRLVLNSYKAVKVSKPFATFRMGGVSQKNWEKSVNEIADFYCKNYGKFYHLTKQKAKDIYLTKVMPEELKEKLKPYLNYMCE